MSAKIPQVQTNDPKFNQYQQNVAKALQLVLDNPLNYGTTLTEIALSNAAANVIPHKLNRTLQGWFITRNRYNGTGLVAAGIQDGQTTNTTPNQTLVLYTTHNVTVDIYVY